MFLFHLKPQEHRKRIFQVPSPSSVPVVLGPDPHRPSPVPVLVFRKTVGSIAAPPPPPLLSLALLRPSTPTSTRGVSMVYGPPPDRCQSLPQDRFFPRVGIPHLPNLNPGTDSSPLTQSLTRSRRKGRDSHLDNP